MISGKPAAGLARVDYGLQAVMAVLLALATGLAAGCSKAPEQDGAAANDVLRGNFNAEPASLNPLTGKDFYGQVVDFPHIFEMLIERDPDTLEWKGMLAEKWEVTNDGRDIVFHLRPEAKFSDGTPVTADDVVFTFDLIRNPGIDCRGLASYFDDCEKCEKVDDHAVRFLWKKTYFKSLEVSGLTPVLPRSVYASMADPKLFNEIVKKPIVGSGPYRLERWDTGQEIVLSRNSDSWKKPPAIANLSYKFILEEQSMVQAFRSGELDYMDELVLTPEWYLKLKESPDNEVKYRLYKFSKPDRGYSYIGWNNARPLFADKRVRRAMTMLINRQQIVDQLLHGLATVISGPFWIQSPQYDQNVKPWPYDKAAALALLKEAGWWDRNGDGFLENEKGERFSFELSVPVGQQVNRDIVRVIQQGLHEAGIEMNAKFYEWSVFVSKLDNRDFDAVRLSWSGQVEDDPYQIWHSSSIANRGSNHVGFKNAEADRLIEEARGTLDEKQRNEIYHQFHRLLHEEQPYTFLWTTDCLSAFAARVHGVKVHKMGLDDREWYLGKPVLEEKETAAP